jgi:hypothetical protein
MMGHASVEVDAGVAGPVLMSGAQAASRVRELRAYSAARRQSVNAAVSGMLWQWLAAWDWRGKSADAASLQVRVRDAADPTHDAWKQKWMACGPESHGAGFPRARWRAGDVEGAPEFPAAHFAACLWGASDERPLPEPAPAPTSLAAEMALSMWQDLWRRWAVACAPEGAARALPPPGGRSVDWPHPGEFSGVLLIEFFAVGLQWTVALDAAGVEALLVKAGAEKPGAVQAPARQASRVRVDTALRQHTLVLDAYLRPCTLTLGGLQNLRVGDVIALEHPLDQPSQLFSENREQVAQAWMTQTNGFKSLELADSSKHPETT